MRSHRLFTVGARPAAPAVRERQMTLVDLDVEWHDEPPTVRGVRAESWRRARAWMSDDC